jgi:hypothetical protein
MNTWKRNAALALLAAAMLSAHAQGSESVFAPFPSRLRASVKDSIVILGWVDSPDLKGGYGVYRLDALIDAATLPSATRVATVAAGDQAYSDAPPDSKAYFYAVLALAEDGSPYQVFIPAKNTTSIGVAVSASPPAPAPAPAPAAAPARAPSPSAASAPSQPAQPFVSAIAAKAKGDAIVITYKASPKSRLVLYRGPTPILRAADLLDASLVAAFTDKDGSFADYPVPGVDYFYAILGEEDLKAGKIGIAAGVNSLASPVSVRAAAVSQGFGETPPASRTPPLPYFLLEDGSGGSPAVSIDDSLPPLRAVSPETAKAIASLLAKAPRADPPMPAPSVLPEEKASPAGGEDYALSLIVSDRIAAKDWTAAADQLRKYLSLNRGPRAAARARFYLGEALALSGSGRDAFFEFLSAREFYPLETKPWIDYVLKTLTEG